MFLKNIIIKNYGSLKNINLEFKKDELGNVQPIILVGKNGSGKTLFLTQIVDSLIELKKQKYDSIREIEKSNFFKMGKKDYIHCGENYSYVSLNYEDNNNKYNYTECALYDWEKFKNEDYLQIKDAHLNIEDIFFKKNGFFRGTSSELKEEFEENIFLYFPIYRYYKPAWLNTEGRVELGFNFANKTVGRNNKNFIKVDILNEIENWILDLILDKLLYETEVENLENINIFKGYFGKNTENINLLNMLLRDVYKSKYPNIEYARIGVMKKEYGRKVSIFIKENNKDVELEIAPTFSHLSSGETMILCLFASILKEYDFIDKDGNKKLKDISGIVLIDEIDLTLHIELAKEILPQVMSLFPKIQFIVTTHSPFFLLGMKEKFGEKYSIIDLPSGNYIKENNFDEIKTAYNIFTRGYTEIQEKLNKVQEKLNKVTKTLIITEGKTDILHLKKAISMLGYDKLNVEFFDFDENRIEMGEGQLDKLLKELSKIKHHNKIIGIFDRDEGKAKKYSKDRYCYLENNVYACSIVNPSFRDYHEGISIELLYKDEDIKRKDENSRRLFLSNEFDETGSYLSENSDEKFIRHSESNRLRKITIKGKEKIVDSCVYEGKKSIALSKNEFSRNIFEEKEGFKEINFDGFKNTLDLLMEIEEIEIFEN